MGPHTIRPGACCRCLGLESKVSDSLKGYWRSFSPQYTATLPAAEAVENSRAAATAAREMIEGDMIRILTIINN
jgi:hypothetical protein